MGSNQLTVFVETTLFNKGYKTMNNNASGILHCDKCFKSSQDFNHISNFYRHVKSHNKVEKCEQCSKVFGNENNLSNHVNSVHSDKVYQCQDCNKTFKKKDHLSNHQIIHSNQVSCISCGRLFKNSRTLKQHSC